MQVINILLKNIAAFLSIKIVYLLLLNIRICSICYNSIVDLQGIALHLIDSYNGLEIIANENCALMTRLLGHVIGLIAIIIAMVLISRPSKKFSRGCHPI